MIKRGLFLKNLSPLIKKHNFLLRRENLFMFQILYFEFVKRWKAVKRTPYYLGIYSLDFNHSFLDQTPVFHPGYNLRFKEIQSHSLFTVAGSIVVKVVRQQMGAACCCLHVKDDRNCSYLLCCILPFTNVENSNSFSRWYEHVKAV